MLALSMPLERPNVYRCAFEDRSRMVLIQQGTRWIAFNPKTCSIQKIWEGEVDWRGKVYDFSQDNSRAKGKVLFDLPSTLWQQDQAWGAPGISGQNGVLSFDTDGASIETPKLNFSLYQNIFVAFDETSRAAPFRVSVVEEKGDWFDSTKHGHSDTDWQWNFKQVWPQSRVASIRWTGPAASAKKKLRNARVFGDFMMFSSNPVERGSFAPHAGPQNLRSDAHDQPFAQPLEIIWKGYAFIKDSLALRFDLKLGDVFHPVDIRIGEEFQIETAPLEGVFLRIPPGHGLEVVGVPQTEVYPLGRMTLKLTGGTK